MAQLAVFISVLLTSVVQPAAQEPVASVGLTAGWATFGQAMPQGAAIDGVQVGTWPTQSDVKNRWPDGSIRFAIVTVQATAAGTYAIGAASASPGSFLPSTPNVAVTLTMNGVPYAASLPPAPSADMWLSGPLVSEWRAVVAPSSSSSGAHPFLRVNFDTRVYNDGKARVDVSVENVLDKTGATTVTYDAAITVNGQAVFTQAAVQHYYLTRWRHVSEVGAAALAAITPDIAPLNASGAVPPYLSLVANEVSAPTGASFAILKAGALDTNMPAHGGRAELAPYPDWTARYLVHRNQTQRAFVLAHGNLSGSWPVHVREAEGSAKSGVGAERLVSLDQRPTLWYDSRAQSAYLEYIKGSPMPIREYGSLTPGPGQSPLIPDTAHQPSLAYVPYLLTGDRYYAEEMAFWANYSMLRTYPSDGVRGADGILAYNEVRGYGWALRNMADAAAYYPDASPLKAYLVQKVVANLQWLDAYANDQDPQTNPFQILWRDKRPEGSQYIGLWEQSYLAHAIDRAHKLGFAGGLAHRDAIAKLQLKLFTSEPDYPRAQGAPYVVGVGASSGGSFVYHTTMGQIWNATQSQTRPFPGYYGPEARLNLMIAVEAGWPGAQAAHDYLWPFIGVNQYWGALPDLAQRAGWALDFTGAPPPSPPPPPPPTPVPAEILAPAQNSTLTSAQQTVNWSAGTGVSSYRLDIGTTAGGSDIYTSGSTSSLSATVSTLPTDGRTLRARLSSNIAGTWQFRDYVFTAVTVTTPTPVPAAIVAPANASTLTSAQQTFTWNAGTGVSAYRLDVGTTLGGSDIHTTGSTASLSATVSALPTDGSALRARLSSNIDGTWQFRDYVFTAVTITTPAPVPGTAPVVHRVLFSEGKGTRTTASFNAPAGALLVAFAGSDGPSYSSQRVTISGAALPWTRVQRANRQWGTSEIWMARATTALADVRVRSRQAATGYRQSLTVVVFTGASGTGASAAAHGSTGAPRVSLVTTKPSSLVYGVGNDWDHAIARTLGANQVMVHQWVDTYTGDTYWVQAWASVVATPTAVTLSTTAPTYDRWNLAAVEIVP